MSIEHLDDKEIEAERKQNASMARLRKRYPDEAWAVRTLYTDAELDAEIALRAQLNAHPALPVGTKIRIKTKIRGFNTAGSAEPKIGLTGVVTDKSYDGSNIVNSIPKGKVAVKFLATDMGYYPDKERPYLVLFIPNYAMEAA